MGLVKAAKGAFLGALAEQWRETIEAYNMGEHTVFTKGIRVCRGENTKGRDDLITNGSVIRVYPNQFMMLVDGGKIIDYSAEEGYYTVNDSVQPSMFNGEFGETLKDSFQRIQYGGQSPKSQKVYFINLQEIKGMKFGTRNAIAYYDSFYNAELFLRAHGTYSVKITDPIRFYTEAVPKNREYLEIDSFSQYQDEFLEALQSSINQMSADGVRVSLVPSKARELGRYMADVLDEEWKKMRGMEIQSVGIASISYDDESTKLIHMRNQGAMLGDPMVREGYIQGAMARGMESAGSNTSGAMAGFMGMGLGMNAGGNFMNAASNANVRQMQMGGGFGQPLQGQNGYTAPQGHPGHPGQAAGFAGAAVNADAGKSTWTCACGSVNTTKFCPECGAKKPESLTWVCSCGVTNTGKFCTECGKPKNQQ